MNWKFLKLLSLIACLLYLMSTGTSLAQDSKKGFKVQISLGAINNRPIPYEVADHIVQHLSNNIRESEFTNILRGDDKIILTFFTSLRCKDEVKTAVHSIEDTSASAFVKTETWKQDEINLPAEITFNSITEDTKERAPSARDNEPIPKTNQNVPVISSDGTLAIDRKPPSLTFLKKDEDTVTIKADSVPLGTLLKSIAETSDLQYICPQSLANTRLSINCTGVSVDSLLSALKISLNFSIKRTGRIVLFIDSKTER